MMTNALIGLSVAVGLLALLDIFISKKQTDRLADWVTAAWSYLDDLRAFSLADWMRRPRAAVWHAISFTLLAAIVGAVALGVHDRAVLGSSIDIVSEILLAVTLFLMLAPIVMYFSYDFFSHILTEIHGERFWLGLFVAFVVFAVILAASALLLMADEHVIRTQGESLPFWLRFVLGYAKFLLHSLRTASVGVIACLFALLASIALAYVATAILFAGEFVVRRIAEYPKGPIIAVSVICASLLALIKTFTDRVGG
jgi:hypothetical protein